MRLSILYNPNYELNEFNAIIHDIMNINYKIYKEQSHRV